MPFNLQVQDERPQLIMAGAQMFGAGLAKAGDAFASMIDKNKEDAKTMAIGQEVLKGEGYDPNWLKLQSAEKIAGLVQGVQVKAGLQHIRNQNALEAQQMAGNAAFGQAIGAYNNPMGPFQAEGPSPNDRLSAGLAAGGPNIDERGVQAMVNLFQHASNARQNSSMSGFAKMLGGDLAPGQAGPPMSPSMAFLNSLRANPEAINNPQFSHVLSALDRMEAGDTGQVGKFETLAGNSDYGILHTGPKSVEPLKLPGASRLLQPEDFQPLPGKLGEQGGLFAQTADGKLHIVPPHMDSPFITTQETRGVGAAGRLNTIRKEITSLQDAIAKKGEGYRGPIGLSTRLGDDLEKKTLEYNQELADALARGLILPSGTKPIGNSTPIPAPLPKSKADLKKGVLYQTVNGPATWDGQKFSQ